MQVTLIDGLFSSSLWDLRVTEHSLLLNTPGGKVLSVPYTQLRHICVSGETDKRKSLRIETETAVYEGMFPSDEDVAAFLRQLGQLKGCYVDIRLDVDPIQR